MTGSCHSSLILPERFRQGDFARGVLNGASRTDLLASQATLSNAGTGLRLDHRVALSLIVDLRDSGWRVRETAEPREVCVKPPRITSRERQRVMLARWKKKNPQEDKPWLTTQAPTLLRQVVSGSALQIDRITPVIVPCRTEGDHVLFRFLNATWSAPQGRYVGRRLRFLVRDYGHPERPVMGILSLGSSIVRCKERDEWIGWSLEQRRHNLISIMDITVLGAVPPYSLLLGGKLMCYLAASDQIRNYYRRNYAGRKTEQLKRCANDLALLVTSSLFGRSALYNRVRYGDEELIEPVGHTGGYGTLHLSPTTIDLMKQLLSERDILPANRFGDGPNWKMRLVRGACDVLGISHEAVLHHGLRKSLYVLKTAHNSLEYLRGESESPEYRRRPAKQLVTYWKERWLRRRAENPEIIEKVRAFNPSKWQYWR